MDEYVLKQLAQNIYDLTYQIQVLVSTIERQNIMLDSCIRGEAVQVINVN